jgi:hypothetical protein
LRASKDHHRQALKLGSFRLIDMVGDGAFVPLTRVKQPQLSRYKAQHEPDHFIPADVLLDAELAAGYPIMTETLARLQGFRLVAEEGDAASAASIRDVLETIEDGVARLRLATRAAIADGHVDGTEKQDIRRRIDELRRTLNELEGVL